MARKKRQQEGISKWKEAARIVLECVQNNDKRYGKKTLIQMLLGNENQKVNFQKSIYWGALKDKLQFKELVHLFDFLEGEELIGQGLKRGHVYLKERGKRYLEDHSEMNLKWEILEFYHLPYDYKLLNLLRVVRRDISRRIGVEPYRICSDALLERLAILRPKSIGFLYKEAKELLKYMPESIWLEFLRAIHTYEMEEYWNLIEKNLDKTKHYAVKELIENNKSLEEIQEELRLKKFTILKYIEDLCALGKINPKEWLNKSGWISHEVEQAAKYIYHTGISSRRYISQLFRLTYEQFWASRILSHLHPIDNK